MHGSGAPSAGPPEEPSWRACHCAVATQPLYLSTALHMWCIDSVRGALLPLQPLYLSTVLHMWYTCPDSVRGALLPGWRAHPLHSCVSLQPLSFITVYCTTHVPGGTMLLSNNSTAQASYLVTPSMCAHHCAACAVQCDVATTQASCNNRPHCARLRPSRPPPVAAARSRSWHAPVSMASGKACQGQPGPARQPSLSAAPPSSRPVPPELLTAAPPHRRMGQARAPAPLGAAACGALAFMTSTPLCRPAPRSLATCSAVQRSTVQYSAVLPVPAQVTAARWRS